MTIFSFFMACCLCLSHHFKSLSYTIEENYRVETWKQDTKDSSKLHYLRQSLNKATTAQTIPRTSKAQTIYMQVCCFIIIFNNLSILMDISEIQIIKKKKDLFYIRLVGYSLICFTCLAFYISHFLDFFQMILHRNKNIILETLQAEPLFKFIESVLCRYWRLCCLRV